MKVRSFAGRAFLQRIFDNPLCHLKDPAIFALVFVNRHVGIPVSIRARAALSAHSLGNHPSGACQRSLRRVLAQSWGR
jgi:hypothetical protein